MLLAYHEWLRDLGTTLSNRPRWIDKAVMAEIDMNVCGGGDGGGGGA